MVNEEILSAERNERSQVLVIGPNGEQMGLMTLRNALESAYDKGLDLVLMSPQAKPPVCKILDYGKFRFDREKKKKEQKKNQTRVEVKEIQLKCQIDINDFNTKANNARRFLTAGNKVKVLIMFRGRQMTRQEVGRQLMDRFLAAVADLGSADKAPVMEGHSLSVMISPVKPTQTKTTAPTPAPDTDKS